MTFVTLLILSSGLAGSSPVRVIIPDCKRAELSAVERARHPAKLKRLGDEPPAKHYMSVYKTEDGCMKPIIVRENIGGSPPQTSSTNRP